jgi:phosphatidyl-myo-inositol dimannoside synthase
LLPTPAVGRRAVEVMRRHGCESVLFGASAPLGLLAPLLRRAGAGRIIALTHGHEVWWATVPVARRLLRRVGDSVDVMTFVSEWCRERIATALSESAADRMVRLSPGVDGKRFYPGCGGAEVRRRLGIPPDALVVVCTARMVKRKGQDTLVKAWPEVMRRFPSALLLLVGDGRYRPQVQKLADRRGIAASVLSIGAVTWEEVPSYMDAGDVFALPCRTRRMGLEAEAFGIAFLEAQACGLPVLIGMSGGAPEALMSPGSGVVVDPNDVRQVGRALIEILAEGRTRDMSAVTRRMAESGPSSWAAVTARFRNIAQGMNGRSNGRHLTGVGVDG